MRTIRKKLNDIYLTYPLTNEVPSGIVRILPDQPDGSIKSSAEMADDVMPAIQNFLSHH